MFMSLYVLFNVRVLQSECGKWHIVRLDESTSQNRIRVCVLLENMQRITVR